MVTRRSFLKKLLGLGAGVGFYSLQYLPIPEYDLNTPPYSEPAVTPTVTSNPPPMPNPPKESSLMVRKPFLNSKTPITIPTYDGSGQANHPSVIDFKTEFGLESWEGFRYWMAMTPYPHSNSTLENPSILVSKDGINWIVPPGLKNPIVEKPLGNITNHYNSDPELVFDPDQKILILYWREYLFDTYEKIWCKKISLQGKENKILNFEQHWDRKLGLILSPTIWRKNSQEWYMWTTNGESVMNLFISKNGIEWNQGQACHSPWDTWNGGYIPWHISAKPNILEQRIEFLIAGWPKKGNMFNCQLLYATAPMSQPTELSMPLLVPLLKSSGEQQWDNGFIYRSSFVLEQSETTKYRVWYSASSKERAWHIGYMEGELKTTISSSKQM